MVDRLTKFVHFFSLHHPFIAAKVVVVFMQGVFKLHGMPKSIFNDRGAIFTTTFWKELFRLQGIKLAMTLAYHPQYVVRLRLLIEVWSST